MGIRLSDEDRERLGLQQEWIDSFSLGKFMIDDAEALEAAGYEADQFLEDLRGHPVFRNGQPVMDPVYDDDGNQLLDGEGNPKLEQRKRMPVRTQRAVMWLAVRRAGVDVSYADFTFNVNGVEYRADDQPGKDPATAAPPSRRSASGTRSRSVRSSGSSRGKSRS